MLEKMDESIAGILDKLGTHENAEQFLELAAQGYFYQNIGLFILGIICLVLAVVSAVNCIYGFRKESEGHAVVGGLFMFLFFIMGTAVLSDSIQGVFAPETMVITDLIRRL